MRTHPTRGKKLRRDLLTERELAALLEACGDGDAASRNRAFISLVVGTGLRISEALALGVEDVDLRHRRAHIEKGKSKERRIWIHTSAVAPVQQWKATRRRLKLGGPLFCSLRGDPLSPGYYRGIFPALAQDAKLKKRVHAHGLRHVFACRAHAAGVPLRALARQLGHERISTTSTYLEDLGVHDALVELDAAFG